MAVQYPTLLPLITVDVRQNIVAIVMVLRSTDLHAPWQLLA